MQLQRESALAQREGTGHSFTWLDKVAIKVCKSNLNVVIPILYPSLILGRRYH